MSREFQISIIINLIFMFKACFSLIINVSSNEYASKNPYIFKLKEDIVFIWEEINNNKE